MRRLNGTQVDGPSKAIELCLPGTQIAETYRNKAKGHGQPGY